MNSTSTEQAVNCDRDAVTILLLIFTTTTFAVATASVCLRVYLRWAVFEAIGWDDVTIVLGYLFMAGAFAVAWRMVDRGLGRYAQCVSRNNLVNTVEMMDYTEFFFMISTMFSRTSIAIFVGRLFGVADKMKVFLYGYTVFMCVSMIVTAVLTFTTCHPYYVVWDIRPGTISYCSSNTGEEFRSYYNGAVSLLSDLILAFLPAYFLGQLDLPKRTRLSLMGLMAVGLIPALCCVGRIVLLGYGDSSEPLRSNDGGLFFSAVEESTLVICACIPVIKGLFTKGSWQRTSPGLFGWRFQPTLPNRLSGKQEIGGIRVTREWDVRSAIHTSVSHSIRTLLSDRSTLLSSRGGSVQADAVRM